MAHDESIEELLETLRSNIDKSSFVELIEYDAKSGRTEGQRILLNSEFGSQFFKERMVNYLSKGSFFPNNSYNNPENKTNTNKPKIMFLSAWENSARAYGSDINYWGYAACTGTYTREQLDMLSMLSREEPDLVILEECSNEFDLRYARYFKQYRPGMPILILGYRGKHLEESLEIPGVFYFNMEKQGDLRGLEGFIEILLS